MTTKHAYLELQFILDLASYETLQNCSPSWHRHYERSSILVLFMLKGIDARNFGF